MITAQQPEREPDDVMAQRLFPRDSYLQTEWLRAVGVVRGTTGGWVAEQRAERKEARQ